MSKNGLLEITTEETVRTYVKSANADDSNKKKNKYQKRKNKDNEEKKSRRFPSVQRALIPNPFHKLRRGFKKLNCFKSQTEEELPMMEVPRHKSIDIGVGLARRVSLFLFTRRTVCVHPYHPFTPEQTTRKIYVFHD